MFMFKMSATFRLGLKISNPIIFSGMKDLNPRIFQRGIKGKVFRCILAETEKKKAPWPYRTKPYRMYNFFFDKTSSRMEENSKLIVVEGPVAAGKTKFAKELAADLGMYHLPEANIDMLLTNKYGFNFKTCDPQLPPDVRSFDIKDFLLNPRHRHAAKFQIMQYKAKFSQYLDALAHLFSTGQGVVLERCVYSDFVFLEAMYCEGFLSKGARSVYYEIRKNNITELMRPHLVIYLDVSVNKVIEKIKKRNIATEVQSKALTERYLQIMEDKYKQNYLKEMSKYSELLVYDWSEEGDMEVVVEDVERLEFKREDIHDLKFSDWEFEFEEDWAVTRAKYANEKDSLMESFYIPRMDVPELVADGQDCFDYYNVFRDSPGNTYEYGYNASMGDTGLATKTGIPYRNTLPLIERKFD